MIFLGFSVRAEPAHQNQGNHPVLLLLGQRFSSNHEHGRGGNLLKEPEEVIRYLHQESELFFEIDRENPV